MAASSGCSICPPPLYTPTLAESCSAREREVIYGVSPQPGSGWHGPICQELVGIAGETSPARQPIAAIYGLFNASRFVIGDFFCPTELTRPQLTRGIWGLGAEPRAAFELCERGGALWLGGYDADRLVAPMRYTPARTLAVGGQLAVELAALRLGGLTVALPAALRRSTGLDSGSEQIIVPPAACAELSARIEQAAVASGARPLTLDLFAPSRPYSICYT